MSPTIAPSLNDLPDEVRPCEHMVTLVSRRADGTLKGPAKWYTDFHVATCPHCKTALKGLTELRKVVRGEVDAAPTDQPRLRGDEWNKIEEGWNSSSDRPAR